MKTFMLGWEFPPFISGGLGTACYGLSKALDRLGVKITFVLPRSNPDSHIEHVKMMNAGNIENARGDETSTFENTAFRTISSSLRPYSNPETHKCRLAVSEKKQAMKQAMNFINPGAKYSADFGDPENYGGDLYFQVYQYAQKAAQIAAVEDFDIIHAHDWMTYPAGIAAARISQKPLVVQVHATEFDRSGEQVNQQIYDIERQGMHFASKVITVSNFTRNIVTQRYGISPEKVEVVYNGVEPLHYKNIQPLRNKADKIVLFLGRITMQKGPEYFLAAAKKVLEVIENVKFIMAGDGDMMNRTMELAAKLGIGHKVFFTGFLRGEDVQKAYQAADLYVMPSVSEPFGIAPLEAIQSRVPVLISKQSGIAELLVNALKVDFWDIREMANKIVAVLKYPPLQQTLQKNSFSEVSKFRWENSAARIKNIYERILFSHN
jgi:glycosyltransferase involved in cell wall biosynthesis